MKNVFYILIAAFSLILHAKCVGQNNIVYGAGISYTNGVPTFVPPSKSARVAIDTVTSKWYEYATPGGWRWSGDRVQDISGCSAPAYVPGKAQSRLVLNSCTEAQNGHGPELYKYAGSDWLCLNCGGNYTAGDGIDITGNVITNTGDLSNTNEIQNLSLSGQTLGISSGNTVTLPTPSTNLDALTDVTITAPSNNQILQYNSAGSQWVNATLSAITGTLVSGRVPFANGTSSLTTSANLLYNSGGSSDGHMVLSPAGYGDYYNPLTIKAQSGGNASQTLFKVLGSTGAVVMWYSEGNGLTVSGLNLPAEYFNWGVSGNATTPPVRLRTRSGFIEFHDVNYNSKFVVNPTTGITLINSANTGASLSVKGQGNTTGNTAVFQNSSLVNSLVIKDSGAVVSGAASPASGAAFDVTSTTGGVLFPRMTATQRDAIASPPDGLVLYNTTAAKLQVRAASTWVDLH